MATLSVNLNKVALLRNTREIGIPSVTRTAGIAIAAGCQGITVHPRPDARHIRPHDVYELAELLKSTPHVEFNIEGNPFHNLLQFVRAVRPQQCTLVPDETGQATSDHGWDLPKDSTRLLPIVNELNTLGVRVSLFMDPIPEAMEEVRKLGADRVEFFTEPYAAAFATPREDEVLNRYVLAGVAAQKASLGINAGHDLNLQNLPLFVAAIDGLQEVSIGHALIADALELGLDETVRRYRRAAQGHAK